MRWVLESIQESDFRLIRLYPKPTTPRQLYHGHHGCGSSRNYSSLIKNAKATTAAQTTTTLRSYNSYGSYDSHNSYDSYDTMTVNRAALSTASWSQARRLGNGGGWKQQRCQRPYWFRASVGMGMDRCEGPRRDHRNRAASVREARCYRSLPRGQPGKARLVTEVGVGQMEAGTMSSARILAE